MRTLSPCTLKNYSNLRVRRLVFGLPGRKETTGKAKVTRGWDHGLWTSIWTCLWERCALYVQTTYGRHMKSRRAESTSVIGYTRVSTEDQRISGLGLADQKCVIEREAERRGWSDVTYLSDEGYSAKNLTRPAIATALRMLADGRATVLVVSKLDRLSRSVLDFAALLERATKEGWQLVVLDLNVDTTTPSGQLVAHVMGAFSQYERQLIGARTAAALAQKKAQGARLGPPRQVTPEVVDRIVAERTAGASLRAIAAGLTADGVPTARGGAVWQASTVVGVLKSVALDAETAAVRGAA